MAYKSSLESSPSHRHILETSCKLLRKEQDFLNDNVLYEIKKQDKALQENLNQQFEAVVKRLKNYFKKDWERQLVTLKSKVNEELSNTAKFIESKQWLQNTEMACLNEIRLLVLSLREAQKRYREHERKELQRVVEDQENIRKDELSCQQMKNLKEKDKLNEERFKEMELFKVSLEEEEKRKQKQVQKDLEHTRSVYNSEISRQVDEVVATFQNEELLVKVKLADVKDSRNLLLNRCDGLQAMVDHLEHTHQKILDAFKYFAMSSCRSTEKQAELIVQNYLQSHKS